MGLNELGEFYLSHMALGLPELHVKLVILFEQTYHLNSTITLRTQNVMISTIRVSIARKLSSLWS